eukprot:COSAG04_NODE_980_length_9017_cov_64.916797_8_plen_620_part_00
MLGLSRRVLGPAATMDEAAQIEAWRKQMQAEEEEEYAAEQAAAASGRADMAAMRSTDGLPGGGTVRFREAQEERTIPSAIPSRGAAGPVPTREPPPAAAAAPAPSVGAGFDWNANTMQQLQEFQGQNADLQQALRKKERELERYKRDQELSSLTGGISAQVSPGKKGRGDTDPRDAKIVELAKKNRAMSLDVQRERDKSSRLAGELKRTEQAMQMVQANPEAMRHATKAALPKDREKKQTWSLEGGDPDKGSASADADVKALKDKLREANSRLNHQTVQAEKAKQELASVKRALAKEVGDGVDVKKVIAEGGGWRGRAQQISMLKDKLRESKRALDATRTSVQGAAPTLTMAEMQAQAQASAALAQDPAYAIDQKNRKHISELGRKGRRENEEMEARLQQALDAKDAQRQKYEGASARVKNLEKDMKAMKAKVLLVLEKSTNDDKLIAALKEQVRVGGGGGGGRAGADDGAAQGEGGADRPAGEDHPRAAGGGARRAAARGREPGGGVGRRRRGAARAARGGGEDDGAQHPAREPAGGGARHAGRARVRPQEGADGRRDGRPSHPTRQANPRLRPGARRCRRRRDGCRVEVPCEVAAGGAWELPGGPARQVGGGKFATV